MSEIKKKIKDKEIYEKIIFDNEIDKDAILTALEIVKLYIIKKKLILVGGMAIDFALRKKEKKLYPDNTLPDYDFFSPNFHHDAYNIANELHQAGLTRISVINAFHASTMRVRINFQTVADCTYVPKNVFDGLPTVSWENFRIIHPHYQMLNQHLALCQPYSGSPWETIHRWKKDIKRFNILDKEYPIDDKYEIKQKIIDNYQTFDIDVKSIKDLCLNGFAALIYWYELAKKEGFSPSPENVKEFAKLGTCTINEGKLKAKIPIAYMGKLGNIGLSLYSDNREILKQPFLAAKVKEAKEIKKYNAFLDQMPRRILIDDRFEIIDNRGNMVSAYKEKMWIINLQALLKYFSLNYMVSFNILKLKTGYCFYLGYIMAYAIVKWAAESYKKSPQSTLMKYLPSHEVFGKYSWHETYIVQRKVFQMTIGKIPRRLEKDKPNVAYIESPEDYPIAVEKYDFDPTKSEIYQFDYLENKKPFKPVILFDDVIDNEP
jgi:hypothetical protein